MVSRAQPFSPKTLSEAFHERTLQSRIEKEDGGSNHMLKAANYSTIDTVYMNSLFFKLLIRALPVGVRFLKQYISPEK